MPCMVMLAPEAMFSPIGVATLLTTAVIFSAVKGIPTPITV